MPAGFINLGDLIRRECDRDKIAIIDLGGETAPREISYGELDAIANGVARALLRRGLARGDRIGVLSANRAEFLAACYGIMISIGIAGYISSALIRLMGRHATPWLAST